MKFCPECGSLYKIDHLERSYICAKCGKSESLNEAISIVRNPKESDKVIVVGQKERDLSVLPKTKAKCPKCGNNQAFWWMVQTRSVDESSTQFYRCTECRTTWREYS